jgi:hypothetical protein
MRTLFSRISRFARRVREIWTELDDAQRRLLEIQTGRSLRRDDRPTTAVTANELDALYGYEDPNLVAH